ncbi:hypothetical protein K491DRAFT_771896 [Lophiostoma macrostomum CBS 122681]|uniref:Aminoglycoside phosphotransferase domain-containing protein n=1 Tax=Lophiostoma macrostomum CBS 122681 TaxID=1314788 RepID=A0A6A6SM16_9PLEO|nr:hypothetical protein K491DRAFT_771896 [Lophiostoma macrostomum CBS 122681]
MRDAIPRLEAFIEVLPQHAAELNNVKLRLAHKDLHFANIMYDLKSEKITSVLDWEFSGVVPFPLWNPRRSFLWNGQDDENSGDESFGSTSYFLRAITEVAPRGQRVELVEGWKKVVLDNIAEFGV